MFYNDRLELCRISVKNTGTAPANCASGTTGNVFDLTYSYPSGNNGNIAAQTNNVTSGRTETYTYDPLNRLLTAQAQATSGGDCWGQSFGNGGPPSTMASDALANLFYTSSIKCSSPAPQYTMNTANNNQFTGTGISYDADGDMTQDTAFSYTYDAENRIITASGMTGGPYCYNYDGNGIRVMKAHASGGSCTGTVTVDMLYWRSILGESIAETDAAGSTTNSNYNEYIFFTGRRIAQSNPSSGSVYYYVVDHLGSTRVVTAATGTVCYEVDYLPYGTENTPAGFTNTCSTRYRFTGYERDPETAYGTSSGNDYAFARYYNSRLGRFMTGDPLAGNIGNPQSLNRYAHVLNDPINRVDRLGLNTCWDQNGNPFECPGPNDSITVSADSSDPLSTGSALFGPYYQPACFGGVCGAPAKDPCLEDMRYFGLRGRELRDACARPGSNAKPQMTASTHRTPWYKNSCITSALGAGALSVGIDSIGLIPEAGGIARVIGHQAGYVGVVADQLGSRVVGAVEATTSTANGLAGLGDTSPEGLLSTGLTVAGFIPGAGTVASGLSIGLDIFKTATAIAKCH